MDCLLCHRQVPFLLQGGMSFWPNPCFHNNSFLRRIAPTDYMAIILGFAAFDDA
jgi:hypothetical protein